MYTLSLFREKLYVFLKPYTHAIIFFSGGVDSSFLLKEVHGIFGENLFALTFASTLQTQTSICNSRDFCAGYGIKQRIIDYTPLSKDAIMKNSLLRCYVCKRKMFSMSMSSMHSLGKKIIFMDGSHLGDDPLLRPGMKANREFGIISPLRELGCKKVDLRYLARASGISFWDKPSDSCLATRFPLGYQLSEENLKKLEVAEEALKKIGLRRFRLRPADSPPCLLLSSFDLEKTVVLGIQNIWELIREKTGWEIKGGVIAQLPQQP